MLRKQNSIFLRVLQKCHILYFVLLLFAWVRKRNLSIFILIFEYLLGIFGISLIFNLSESLFYSLSDIT